MRTIALVATLLMLISCSTIAKPVKKHRRAPQIRANHAVKPVSELDSLCRNAQKAYDAGEYEKSERLWKEALRLSPTSVRIQNRLRLAKQGADAVRNARIGRAIERAVAEYAAQLPKIPPKPSAIFGDFLVTDLWCDGDWVGGSVYNGGKNTCSYVQVEVNLYGADGAQIGSTMDNLTNFEAGSWWRFKAMILGRRPTSYRIVQLSGIR